MYRTSYKKYLLIGVVLFLLLSLPTIFVETLRGKTMRALSFVFKGANFFVRNKTSDLLRLDGENHLLRLEINKLRTLLEQRAKTELFGAELSNKSLTPKRYEEMQFLANLMHQAIPARVIYRDPSSWSSSVWVNVGEATNKVLKRRVVQKNSPVILGKALVGVVDFVGKKQARIRLITDSALKPSVRAVRGFSQNSALIEHVDSLMRQLQYRGELFFTHDEKNNLLQHLEQWREKLRTEMEDLHLAKGIVHGGGTPLWRSVNQTLRGIGFNYDFADEEGPARELETGKPLQDTERYSVQPIIKINDLLVTTGMDGIFPPGLRVAEVTKIHALREGAYTYELEAIPAAENLDNLQTIFIIPPLGYDPDDTF